MSMNYDFDLTHNLTVCVVLTIWFDLALVGHTLMYTYVMYVFGWAGSALTAIPWIGGYSG